jgi:proline racemase
MYPVVMKKVKETEMEHPEWPGITWNGHTIIEDDPTLPKATHKNATLAPPRRYFDKSPCGSGTCGNMGILYSKGKLKLKEPFVNENLMGTATFTGQLTSKVKVGDFDAATPEYSGSAYITAISTVLVDPTDPFKHGFQDLKDPERAKFFQYAW